MSLNKTLMIVINLISSISMSLFSVYMFGRNSSTVIDVPLFAASLYTLTEFSIAFVIVGSMARSTIIAGSSGRGMSSVFRLYRQCRQEHLLRFVIPCAAATAVNTALSNASLGYISLAIYVMIKSVSPMFLLIFAVLFKLERLSMRVCLIVLIILAGLALSAMDTKHVSPIGLALVSASAVASGLRWVLVQLIIDHHRLKNQNADANGISNGGIHNGGILKSQQMAKPLASTDTPSTSISNIPSSSRLLNDDDDDNESKYQAGDGSTKHSSTIDLRNGQSISDLLALTPPASYQTISSSRPSNVSTPLVTILLLAPSVSVLLALLSLIIEGPWRILSSVFFGQGWYSAAKALGLCVISGTQMFIQVSLDYQVVHETSALIFSLLGLVKELILVLISIFLLGDTVHWLNYLGGMVSVVGITYYALSKPNGDPEEIDSDGSSSEASLELSSALSVKESILQDVCHGSAASHWLAIDPKHVLLGATGKEELAEIDEIIDEQVLRSTLIPNDIK